MEKLATTISQNDTVAGPVSFSVKRISTKMKCVLSHRCVHISLCVCMCVIQAAALKPKMETDKRPGGQNDPREIKTVVCLRKL